MTSEPTLRARFDAEATPVLLDKLHRVARARVRVYAGRTHHVSESDAEDIVMSCLADTMDGTLRWDPAKKPLEPHLLDAIRFRVRDLARKRLRELQQVDVRDAEAAAVSADDRARELGRLVTEVVVSLEERIGDDHDVALLLDAMVRHRALERAEILKETRMSKAAYRNARRRLDRILLQLPADLRRAP
jgi:hypothetical protein